MSQDIPHFVELTPFGPYCGPCDVILSLEKGIINHGKEFHPEIPFKNAVVVHEIKKQITDLQVANLHDLSSFLKLDLEPKEHWFCDGCFVSFYKRSNYLRHLSGRYTKCASAHGRKVLCFPTVCGRRGPKSILSISAPPSVITTGSSLSSLTRTTASAGNKTFVSLEVPEPLMQSSDEAIQILTPFVRPDECAGDLSMIFLPLLNKSFEGTIRDFIKFSCLLPKDEPILCKWIEAGRVWLNDYAAGHIANVSANVRSRLAEFEQRELDGTTVGTRTFTLRRGVPRLMGELDHFLRFLNRFPTTLFDDFKNEKIKSVDTKWMIQNAIIPRILFIAAKEEPTNHGEVPVACKYCLSCGFSIKIADTLQMNECGWFSSRISTVMHLLRAGVCGYLVTLTANDSSCRLGAEEMEIVRTVQHGRVTNLLAPRG